MQPLGDPWGFMDGWQNVVIWTTLFGVIFLVAVVWGVVAIVKAIANRHRRRPEAEPVVHAVSW